MSSWLGYDRPSWYDGMQVCVNGHRITAYATSQPEHCQNHCATCGARTITACESCNTPMRGHYHVDGVISLANTPVPKYCIACGQAFPWQQAAIENLKDVLEAGDMASADVDLVVLALPDVIHETPRTEGAALKLRKALGKLGKPTYDIAVKVITDLASETAKKTMGL